MHRNLRVWFRSVVIPDFRSDIDSRQQHRLSRCGLRQALHAHRRVNCQQGRALSMKRRGGSDQRPAVQQGVQVWHPRFRKRIDRRVVLAQPDAVEEDEQDFHSAGL